MTQKAALAKYKNKCTQGMCASYLPLQVSGNICGASVVVWRKCCRVVQVL